MPSPTLKAIPHPLYERLKHSAQLHRRSINSEALVRLVLMMRQEGLGIADALELIARAERLLGQGDYRVAPALVLELAAQSGCTAYDCEFVALARELGVVLLTADKAVLKAFPTVALAPETFIRR